MGPITLILRERLKYALTRREVMQIVMRRLVAIDHKVRTDITYPAGFMDVITIQKTDEKFRLLYNNFHTGQAGAVPYVVTHDGRTIRYADPLAKIGDTVKLDLTTGKTVDTLKFEAGNVCMVTQGANKGRVGILTSREKHHGGFEISHLKDRKGNAFATRSGNVFVIGDSKPWITLPRGKGIKLSIIEEREKAAKGSK